MRSSSRIRSPSTAEVSTRRVNRCSYKVYILILAGSERLNLEGWKSDTGNEQTLSRESICVAIIETRCRAGQPLDRGGASKQGRWRAGQKTIASMAICKRRTTNVRAFHEKGRS